MDLAPLRLWPPEQVPAVEATLSPQAEFGQALREAGLDLGGRDPIMDGQIHRACSSTARLTGMVNRTVPYQGHLDGVPAGFIQNHKAGEKQTWKATGHALSPEQIGGPWKRSVLGSRSPGARWSGSCGRWASRAQFGESL